MPWACSASCSLLNAITVPSSSGIAPAEPGVVGRRSHRHRPDASHLLPDDLYRVALVARSCRRRRSGGPRLGRWLAARGRSRHRLGLIAILAPLPWLIPSRHPYGRRSRSDRILALRRHERSSRRAASISTVIVMARSPQPIAGSWPTTTGAGGFSVTIKPPRLSRYASAIGLVEDDAAEQHVDGLAVARQRQGQALIARYGGRRRG